MVGILPPHPSQMIPDDPSASIDNKCAPSQAPIMEGSQYDHLSYDELHTLCKSRGYCEKDAKTALKTRLEAMDTVARNSSQLQTDNMDTSYSVLGKERGPSLIPILWKRQRSWALGSVRVEKLRQPRLLLIWRWSKSALNGGPPTSNPKWPP